MKYIFAIRDTDTGLVHSSRYSSIDDAMSAAEELSYQHEIPMDEIEIVEIVERVNSSRRVAA